jgi:hypothetical protein
MVCAHVMRAIQQQTCPSDLQTRGFSGHALPQNHRVPKAKICPAIVQLTTGD